MCFYFCFLCSDLDHVCNVSVCVYAFYVCGVLCNIVCFLNYFYNKYDVCIYYFFFVVVGDVNYVLVVMCRVFCLTWRMIGICNLGLPLNTSSDWLVPCRPVLSVIVYLLIDVLGVF